MKLESYSARSINQVTSTKDITSTQAQEKNDRTTKNSKKIKILEDLKTSLKRFMLDLR